MAITVLSASADPALRHSRELLLRAHGCEVKTSLSKSHAQELDSISFLRCTGIRQQLDTRRMSRTAKDFRSRNPQGKIIEILAANWKAPMNQPDATALSPEELIAAIRGFA